MLGFFDHVANGIILSDDDGTYIGRGIHEGTPLGLEYVKAVFELMSTRPQFVFEGTPDYESTARILIAFAKYPLYRTHPQKSDTTSPPVTQHLEDSAISFAGSTFRRMVGSNTWRTWTKSDRCADSMLSTVL